jgi:hypothetical protein
MNGTHAFGVLEAESEVNGQLMNETHACYPE